MMIVQCVMGSQLSRQQPSGGLRPQSVSSLCKKGGQEQVAGDKVGWRGVRNGGWGRGWREGGDCMKLSLRHACRDAVAAPQERWVHNLPSCTNQASIKQRKAWTWLLVWGRGGVSHNCCPKQHRNLTSSLETCTVQSIQVWQCNESPCDLLASVWAADDDPCALH